MYITSIMVAWFLLIMAIFFFIVAVSLDCGKTAFCLFPVIVFSFLYVISDTSEEKAEKQRLQQIENAPKPILEKDGCIVYKFHDMARDHYFTKCPINTTTETTYSETCGKNCTRVKSELIETTN